MKSNINTVRLCISKEKVIYFCSKFKKKYSNICSLFVTHRVLEIHNLILQVTLRVRFSFCCVVLLSDSSKEGVRTF